MVFGVSRQCYFHRGIVILFFLVRNEIFFLLSRNERVGC